MIGLLIGQDEVVGEFVAERIPHVAGFRDHTAIGIVRDGRLLAGVVYHDWQRDARTIQISAASDSPMWAKPKIIRQLLHYPFEQLKCYKIWTAIPLKSENVVRFNEHLGFKREATLAHQFGPKNHAVICRMLLSDYVRTWKNG